MYRTNNIGNRPTDLSVKTFFFVQPTFSGCFFEVSAISFAKQCQYSYGPFGFGVESETIVQDK